MKNYVNTMKMAENAKEKERKFMLVHGVTEK